MGDWEDEPGDEDSASCDSDDDYLTTCPYCGESIYDDAERCPKCQNYISDEDAPAGKRPWWFALGFLLCLLILYLWIFGF